MTVVNHQHTSDKPLLGVSIIIATVFLMATADALVKFASQDISLWQVFTVRSVIVVGVLLAIFFLQSKVSQPFMMNGWVLLRSALLTLMYISIYAGMPVLDLTTIAVALYTGPIFITLFSAYFIKQPISHRKWLAVFTGFIGVLIALQPNQDDFQWAAVIPIIGAICYALAAVLTRKHCTQHSPISLAISLNVTLLITGLVVSVVLWALIQDSALKTAYPFLLGDWAQIDNSGWVVLIVLALLMLLISLGFAKAYQVSAPELLAPFDYSYLIFATLWGVTIFSEALTVFKIIGITLIVLSGLIAVENGFWKKIRIL